VGSVEVGMREPTAQLEYAPKAAAWRRRNVRRVVGGVVVVVLVLAGIRWGPAVWRQGELLYWQRECLRYEPPAEGVLFEGDVGRAAALRKGSGDYVVAGQPVGAVYFQPSWGG
jgi:hypothetical protein